MSDQQLPQRPLTPDEAQQAEDFIANPVTRISLAIGKQDAAFRKRVEEAGSDAMLAEAAKIIDEREAFVRKQELARLDEAEAAELKKLKRGENAWERAQIQTKYHELKGGNIPAGKIEKGSQDEQDLLMAAYKIDIAGHRGDVKFISDVQAKYRRKGLQI